MDNAPFLMQAEKLFEQLYDRSVRYMFSLPHYSQVTLPYLNGRLEAFLYWIDPRALECGMIFLGALLLLLVLLEVHDCVRHRWLLPLPQRLAIYGTATVHVVESEKALRDTASSLENLLGYQLRRCCYHTNQKKKGKKKKNNPSSSEAPAPSGFFYAGELPASAVECVMEFAALQRTIQTATGPMGLVSFVITRDAILEGLMEPHEMITAASSSSSSLRTLLAATKDGGGGITQYTCYFVDSLSDALNSIHGLAGAHNLLNKQRELKKASFFNRSMQHALIAPGTVAAFLDIRDVKALTVDL